MKYLLIPLLLISTSLFSQIKGWTRSNSSTQVQIRQGYPDYVLQVRNLNACKSAIELEGVLGASMTVVLYQNQSAVFSISPRFNIRVRNKTECSMGNTTWIEINSSLPTDKPRIITYAKEAKQ